MKVAIVVEQADPVVDILQLQYRIGMPPNELKVCLLHGILVTYVLNVASFYPWGLPVAPELS